MSLLLLEGPGGIPGIKLRHGFYTNYPFQALGGFANVESTVDVTTAAVTLTKAQSGSNVLLDIATTTVTLPADVQGLNFHFIVATAATAQKVIIQSASSFFTGNLDVPVATGTRKSFFGDGSTLLSINLNGTTTGGLQGGDFTLVCLKVGLWLAVGAVEGSGTVATPFATS